ncbi:MAG TPA: ParB/RepB/Spo0J family partition protein [Acidobacteriaceae bacterium]|jgi:ParB family chromosome partitioning protein|nr:ParB/RepB/Spo0J family partition protein [Acidobacteriaceae bacterium]
MTTAVQSKTEYRNLPLAALQESPINPRRRFDERALEELAASVRAQGVLQPLLVRALDKDKYEIVIGARRFRAAQRAEKADVPVRIRELTDAQCVEIQLVENIQREGVHPMEEASAFYALLHTDGLHYDINSLAAKAGKSPAFVAQRLKLADLIPSIADAFLADQIGVGHALEIAKLPQEQQQKAFDAAFRTLYGSGKDARVLVPLRDFIAWIEQNILLSLDSVPFDKNDATLVPEAGSCAECPKRTGFNTLLFGEGVHDACSDAGCHQNKLGKFVERQIAEKPKLVQISTNHVSRNDGAVLSRSRYVALHLARNGKAKQPLSPYQKPCKHMTEAIVVDGTERGHTVKVCAEPSCTIHFADRRSPDPAQVAREREQRRRELEKRKLEITVRHRILAEVLKRVGAPLDRADLVLIASAMLERMEPLRRETLARWYKMVDGTGSEVTFPQVQKALQRLLRQLDESGLSKLIVEVVLLGSIESAPSDEADVLTATAKRHRVDVAKMRTTVESEFAAKQAKTAAKQKKATPAKSEKAAKAA